jgi:cobalt transport protein
LKDSAKYALGFIIIGLIIVVAVAMNPNSGFPGSDELIEELIKLINPSFDGGSEPIWAPSQSLEAGLFAVAALIGGIIIGYFIGRKGSNRRPSNPQGD